jgi:hypothetical protein
MQQADNHAAFSCYDFYYHKVFTFAFLTVNGPWLIYRLVAAMAKLVDALP